MSEARSISLGMSHLAMSRGERLPLKPTFAEPVSDGSSTGLVHLRSVDQISAAVDQLVAMPVPYLAEAFIEGRELTVGVIDEGHGPVALPVSEVRLEVNATFDYAGKYWGKGTEEVTLALLAPTPARGDVQFAEPWVRT